MLPMSTSSSVQRHEQVGAPGTLSLSSSTNIAFHQQNSQNSYTSKIPSSSLSLILNIQLQQLEPIKKKCFQWRIEKRQINNDSFEMRIRTNWKRQCHCKEWCVFSSNAIFGLGIDEVQEVEKKKTKICLKETQTCRDIGICLAYRKH